MLWSAAQDGVTMAWKPYHTMSLEELPDVAAFTGLSVIIPTTVEIDQSLYIVELFSPGLIVPGTNVGNRTLFPIYDITA